MISPAVEPVLSIDRLTLSYTTDRGALTAIDDVSFDVQPGERLVILGPSGCGKSTLLKAIGGFVRSVAGTIVADGVPVSAPGPDRMMVFQEQDQLLPWRTVLGNVAFPMIASRRFDRRTALGRAAHMVERVGLGPFARAFPHTLSGGMKQRVAIARALALQPKMLLMDEPFAALDALTRRRMQSELLGLWRELGFTLVFVTHSIDEAVVVGSRVLALTARPGRIRMTADVSALGEGNRTGPAFGRMLDELNGLFAGAGDDAN